MRLVTAIAAAMLLSVPAHAMDMHAHHPMPAKMSGKMGKVKRSAAIEAYIASAGGMHQAMNITYTGDADIDFARGMVPHHQGAVNMVEVLHKYGKDAELRELGKRIVTAQNAEIGIMKRWLETHDNPKLPAVSNARVDEYRAAMERMHQAMSIRYTGDADVDFVHGMIPHHQGAIDMAWILLKHGHDPMLRDICHDVIRSQQQEIAFMQDWLKRHGK